MKKIFLFLILTISLYANFGNFDFNVDAKIVNNDIKFDIFLKKDSYIYADKLKFSFNNGFSLNDLITFPETILHKNTKVFDKNFDILIPLSSALLNNNSDNFDILVSFQGCSYDDFCYEPQNFKFNFIKTKDGYKISKEKLKDSTNKQKLESNQISTEEEKIVSNLENKSAIISIISFFGFGILLSLTPCNLPLVPIVLNIILSKKSSIFSIIFYIFGMSLAYGLIGLFVSLIGLNLQNFFQTPFVIILFSIIFVILSLGSFGVFEIKMPSKIESLISEKSNKLSGFGGIFIMGFFSALIVGPCIAPPLSGALIFISKSNSLILGFFLLFFMGIGLGVPLLLLSILSKRIKASEISVKIQKFLGFILLFMAIWMLSRIVDQKIINLMYGILGVFLASFIGFNSFLSRSFAILILIFSSSFILNFEPKTSFEKNNSLNFSEISNLGELDNYIANNKLVLLDVSASWCTICKDIEKNIFQNRQIINSLSNYKMLKLDISENSSAKKEILKHFDIFGPPAILIFKDKKLVKKIVGNISSNEFLKNLKDI